MGFTDTSEVSSTPDSTTTAISGELVYQLSTSGVSDYDDLSDYGWIALANCDHDHQSFVTDIPFTAPVLALSSCEYHQVLETDLLLKCAPGA
jgi:hypothetical protein